MLLLFITMVIPCAISVSIDSTVSINPSATTEYYSATVTLDFYQIDINKDYVGFNNTYFNITSANPIWINLTFVTDNIAGLASGDTALTFNAETTTADVTFEITGFEIATDYGLYKDGVAVSTITSDGTGLLTFTTSITSNTIELKKGAIATTTTDATLSTTKTNFSASFLTFIIMVNALLIAIVAYMLLKMEYEMATFIAILVIMVILLVANAIIFSIMGAI